jgi:FkbM family methyltransferase
MIGMHDTPAGHDAWLTVTLPADARARSFRMARNDNRDQVANLAASAGWDAFERPLPRYFYRAVQRSAGGLIVDVGANSGFYSLLAASSSELVRVLAIEPVPYVFDILRRNVRANGLRGRVRLLQCAASDQNGSGALFMPTQEHGLIETSASLRSDFKNAHSGTIRVRLRSLDRMIRGWRLAYPRVAVIKIDVEGCEQAVLSGARRTILSNKPIIFLEILPEASLEALAAFLEADYADVQLSADGRVSVHSRIEANPSAWNHALVPREDLKVFLAD